MARVGAGGVDEFPVEQRSGVRERLGFSKAHVGRIARVTAGAVTNWERGGLVHRSKDRIARERLEECYRWMLTADPLTPPG